MLMHIPQILNIWQLQKIRQILEQASWQQGNYTAGTQSAQVKHNLQLEENDEYAVQARSIIIQALSNHALFFTAALPKKIFPPMFNAYKDTSNYFGNHIDNAVRTSQSGLWVRTDLSATLFLSEADEYEGGELVIEEQIQSTKIKLDAGDMLLYPSTYIHRVEPVTKGCRLASFFWIESMVQDIRQRQILFDMDNAINSLRIRQPSKEDSPEIIELTGCYHNLLRMWAST